MARYQPHHKRTSTAKRVLLWSFAVVATLVAASIIFRAPIISFGLKTFLDSQGLGPTTFALNEIGLTRTDISDVALVDGHITIRSVEIDYTPALLRTGRVNALKVSGFRMAGDWTADGISFGPLDKFFENDGTSSQETPAGQQGEESQSATPVDGAPLIRALKVEDATVVLRREDGEVSINAGVGLSLGDPFISSDVQVSLNGPGIEGSVQWKGNIATDDFLSSDGDGIVQLNLNSFQAPGTNQAIDAIIDTELSALNNTIRLALRRDMEVKAPLPIAFVPPQSDGQHQRNTINFALATDRPDGSVLTLQRAPDFLETSSNFAATVDSPYGAGNISVNGIVFLGQDNLPQDFLFERLSIEVKDALTPYGVVSGVLRGDGLKGPIAVAEGPLKLDGTVLNGRVGDLEVAKASVDAEANFRLDGLSLAFDLKTLSLLLDNGRLGEAVRWDNTAQITLNPDVPAGQSISTVFGADGSATLAFDAGFALDTGPLVFTNENNETSATFTSPHSSIQGFWVSGEEGVELSLNIEQANLATDFARVSAVNFDGQGRLGDFTGILNGRTALVSPGQGNRTGLPMTTQVTWAEDTLTLSGNVASESDFSLGTFSGVYEMSANKGELNLTVGPLSFGGSNISTSDIYPLGLPFIPLSGEFLAELSLPLGNFNTTRQNRILARELEIETGSIRLVQLNTALSLDRAWPPTLTEPQSIAIGLAQAGIPVSNVLADFTVDNSNVLQLTSLSMDLAGGTVAAGPVSIDPNNEERVIPFQVSRLNLTDLAKLSGLGGLDADGELSGVIPLVLSDNDAVISEGALTTAGPGRIQYVSDQGTSQSSDASGGLSLALQAMEDFRYDSLTLTVNGSIMKELSVGIAIKGRNPALYNGYPIDFNLNLEGELANVVRGSLTGYRVPETIKQQLMAFPPGR